MRIRDTEDDVDALKNKSRSLQSQVSKKSGTSPERDLDEKIDREISSFIKKDVVDPPVHLSGREIKRKVNDAD